MRQKPISDRFKPLMAHSVVGLSVDVLQLGRI